MFMAESSGSKRGHVPPIILMIGLLIIICGEDIQFCSSLGVIGDDGGIDEREVVGLRCIESERRALLDIKKDMYDPGTWLSSWRKDGDCCNWRGVECENATRHVTKLDLGFPYDIRIKTSGQFGSFDDPSIYTGNPDLCGYPLSPCSGDTPSNHPPLPHFQEDDDHGNSSEMALVYACAALGFVVGFWAVVGTILTNRSIRYAYFRSIDKLYGWINVKVAVCIARWRSTMAKSNRGHP